MITKLKTYWFILNHILEITDGISSRIDSLELQILQLRIECMSLRGYVQVMKVQYPLKDEVK